MAWMITSGLIFFSRLICSICWRSWLDITLPALANLFRAAPPAVPGRELDFEPPMGDLLEGHACQRAALPLQPQHHHALVHGLDAPDPVASSVHGLVARELREPPDEA